MKGTHCSLYEEFACGDHCWKPILSLREQLGVIYAAVILKDHLLWISARIGSEWCFCLHILPLFLLFMTQTGAPVHDVAQLETLLSYAHLCSAQRSTSLEVSVTARNFGSDAQHCHLDPSSACTNGTRCSQSTPVELAAPSGSSYSERPTGSPHSSDERTANMVTSKVDDLILSSARISASPHQ